MTKGSTKVTPSKDTKSKGSTAKSRGAVATASSSKRGRVGNSPPITTSTTTKK